MESILKGYIKSVEELKKETYRHPYYGVVKIDEEFNELISEVLSRDFVETAHEVSDCLGILSEIWLTYGNDDKSKERLVKHIHDRFSNPGKIQMMVGHLTDWINAKSDFSEVIVIFTGDSRKSIETLSGLTNEEEQQDFILTRIGNLMTVVINIVNDYIRMEEIEVIDLLKEMMVKHNVTRARFDLPATVIEE